MRFAINRLLLLTLIPQTMPRLLKLASIAPRTGVDGSNNDIEANLFQLA
jgi:hypothetical protein